MKGFWIVMVKMVLPMLRAAGEAKKAEDENTFGKDDLIGTALVFAADLLEAIVTERSLPKVPDALK